MESVPQLICACGNCGEVIQYSPAAAGQIVECPRCREKSRLPGPPPLQPGEVRPPLGDETAVRFCPTCGFSMPTSGVTCEVCEGKRRRTLNLIAGVASAVLVLGLAWLLLKGFYNNPRPTQPSNLVARPPPIKPPKSIQDFRISQFRLESKPGSGLAVVVGDISNASLNAYHQLRADADLLDARGAKIGAVSNQITELLPDKNWRFMATVKDPRAKSVRFAGLKEMQ